jgi:chromosome segregation ATPase
MFSSAIMKIIRVLAHLECIHDERLSNLERKSVQMSNQISDLQAAEADLEKAQADEAARVNANIKALNDQITALQNSGHADDPAITAVIAGIKNVAAALNNELPAPAPTPTPTPTTTDGAIPTA